MKKILFIIVICWYVYVNEGVELNSIKQFGKEHKLSIADKNIINLLVF